MKKLNFLALATATAAMLFAFSACDDPATDTENPGGGDNTGEWGGNGDDVRLVEKITFTEDGEAPSGYQFSYDDKNRVVRADYFNEEYRDDEYFFFTLSYGNKTLTVTIEDQAYYEDQDSKEEILYKTISTVTYAVDSDGNILSANSASYKDWENGKLVEEGEEDNFGETNTYTYENGYLKKAIFPEFSDYGNGNYIDREAYYFWANGNLTRIESTDTEIFADGSDNSVTKLEDTFTYSDKINPANVSFDLNAMNLDDDEGLYLSYLGFFGGTPKNLVSSRTHSYGDSSSDTYVTEYDWTLDSEGYVTKMTSTNEYETETITVTYKN